MSGQNGQDLEQQLLDLMRQADDARAKRDKAQGSLDSLMARLEKEFGCKTLAAVEKRLGAMRADAAKLRTQVTTGIAQVREEHGL